METATSRLQSLIKITNAPGKSDPMPDRHTICSANAKRSVRLFERRVFSPLNGVGRSIDRSSDRSSRDDDRHFLE